MNKEAFVTFHEKVVKVWSMAVAEGTEAGNGFWSDLECGTMGGSVH
jgi:hypothetical protein